VYGYGQSRAFQVAGRDFRAFPLRHCATTLALAVNVTTLCNLTAAVLIRTTHPAIVTPAPLAVSAQVADCCRCKLAFVLVGLYCPDRPRYQRGAARQKGAISPTTAPRGTPEVAKRPLRVFDPPLPFRAGCWSVSGPYTPLTVQEASMYFIVEIQLGGTETFLEGFEDSSEAWDVASRLQSVARRRRRKVRYEVR
jgi:hypothetical protein